MEKLEVSGFGGLRRTKKIRMPFDELRDGSTSDRWWQHRPSRVTAELLSYL